METEPKIIAEYITAGKARLIYRHLAQIGEGSLVTAEASECAADQGKFWPMHDALYGRQDEVYAASDLSATLTGFARGLGLDITVFGECIQTHKHLGAVQADYRAATEAGVRSRPVFEIRPGDQRFIGAQPFAVFQRLINAALGS